MTVYILWYMVGTKNVTELYQRDAHCDKISPKP